MSPDPGEGNREENRSMVSRRGLIVFSAPSGGGKTTIIKLVRNEISNLNYSVSAPTRSIRKGEVDSVDYDFLSKEEFLDGIKKNNFIEYEEVHGELYGTRKQRIEAALESGKWLIFDIDVLGALNIKKQYPDALLIYLDVPSVEVLRERLIQRSRENDVEIEKRLKRYQLERSQAQYFDEVVMNDDLDRAVEIVVNLIKNHLNI